eukprot:1387218-Amphidinium_carterae.1
MPTNVPATPKTNRRMAAQDIQLIKRLNLGFTAYTELLPESHNQGPYYNGYIVLQTENAEDRFFMAKSTQLDTIGHLMERVQRHLDVTQAQPYIYEETSQQISTISLNLCLMAKDFPMIYLVHRPEQFNHQTQLIIDNGMMHLDEISVSTEAIVDTGAIAPTTSEVLSKPITIYLLRPHGKKTEVYTTYAIRVSDRVTG